MTVELTRGELTCLIAPSLGGSITQLRLADRDILRPTPIDARSPIETACFPLIPFANRIRNGRMAFMHREYRLTPHALAMPHAHHGHGWQAQWSVQRQTSDFAELLYRHEATAGWDWRYSARQQFQLLDQGIAVTIQIENHDQRRQMPTGCGLHPYFVRSAQSAIVAESSAWWVNDAEGVADQRIASSLFLKDSPVLISQLDGTDNFFEGESLSVLQDGFGFSLSGDKMVGFHVYVPPDECFFCVEPVSHVPDSFGKGQFKEDECIPPGSSRTWHWKMEIATQHSQVKIFFKS